MHKNGGQGGRDRRRRPRGHEETLTLPGSQAWTMALSGDSRGPCTAPPPAPIPPAPPLYRTSMCQLETPAWHTERCRKGSTKERSGVSLPWPAVKAAPSLLGDSPACTQLTYSISTAWDKLLASLGLHFLILGLIIEPTFPD